jgi:hypothetical protein
VFKIGSINGDTFCLDLGGFKKSGKIEHNDMTAFERVEGWLLCI